MTHAKKMAKSILTAPASALSPLLLWTASCSRSDALGVGRQPASTTTVSVPAQPKREAAVRTRSPIEGPLPALEAATGWINSQPLTPAALRGKVVLIQFWTYSCINWRRTMPYLRAWSEKYAASGLLVIGVHTPEFDFEKDAGNVRNFLHDAAIPFPVALDSDERTRGFSSTVDARRAGPRAYPEPPPLQLNQWSLFGDWTIGPEAVTLNGERGRIRYRFHARDLHLVMGPARPGTALRFSVRLDGQAPGDAHGVDVDEQGNGTGSEPRMYQLIRQPLPIGDRDFEIEFLGAPVAAFSFTFG